MKSGYLLKNESGYLTAEIGRESTQHASEAIIYQHDEIFKKGTIEKYPVLQSHLKNYDYMPVNFEWNEKDQCFDVEHFNGFDL